METDETFVGGKPRKHDRWMYANGHRKTKDKAVVWGAVERDGKVHAEVVPGSATGDIRPRVLDTIKAGSVLFSDGYQLYQTMPQFDHAWVDHKADEWARGAVHTQTIEGFWSVMKGGLKGVYRGAVSRKWLQSYVDEYAFHWNHRNALGGPDPFRVLFARAVEA